MVLLDSDSTNTIFCNKEYVNNTRPAPKPLEIQTNGGIMKVNHICEIPYLGTQWFSKNAITNIISLADISKNYRVTMDTDKEKAMIVHLDNRKIKFNEMPGGLYARKPKGQKNINSTDKINESQHLYLTVGDNYKYLSNRQIEKVNKVRKLQTALGMPSNQDLKKIITMNIIKDNDITHEDINLAEKTFGKGIAHVKGKTTRKNEKLDNSNMIEIPEELIYKNKDVEISIDTMYINGLLFLTSISHDTYYRTAQYIPSKHKRHHIKCMKNPCDLM